MSVTVTPIDCGLTVISHVMPQVETVALGVWAGAGSRDEPAEHSGLAHLLEHMAFKGTNTRTAFDIAAQIEAAGGDMNASTSMEKTAYYARVLKDDWHLALDIISDILMHPRFTADDLNLEKGVVLQEIAASRDSPDDLVFNLAQAVAWPDHALGRDILGEPETVQPLGLDHLQAYRARHYTSNRLVVAVAGNLDHHAFVDAVRTRFEALSSGSTAERSAPQFRSGTSFVERPLDQVHQVLAFPCAGYHCPDIYTTYLAASVLGGGMSSRLFQEVRERRGLCYSTFSYVSAFADTGILQVYAATAPETAAEFTNVCADMLQEFAGTVSEEELIRARAQVKASLVMCLESPSARADQIARQYLSYGRVPDVSEILARIDAVTTGDIRRVCEAIFASGRVCHTAVGATSHLARQGDIAARFA